MTDRHYYVNKYGDGKKYGSSDISQNLGWDVSFDWDGDGAFESQEADRMVGFSIERGRKRLLLPNGQGFEGVSTGKASVLLSNHDGRYDGWNSSSPIYPNMVYGKEVRIRVKDLSSGVLFPIITGRITDIRPSGYVVDPVVQFEISDNLEFFRNVNARVAMQQNIAPDDAIGMVLDAVQWPSRWGRDIASSADVIRYWWSSGNGSAMGELERLANSFLGYFFVSREGQASFVSRTTIGPTVENYAQSDILKDIGNPQPYEIRRDIVRLKVHPRISAATGTIWQLVESKPYIENGSTLILFANYAYNGDDAPAINVVTPVATTDWLVNSQENGAGTNLTGGCVMTFTDFGDTAKISIVNNSGVNGYVTLLKIRGDSIYEPNVTDVTYPSDPPENSRELVLDLFWQQDVNVAVDLSNVLGPFYSSLHPMPNIKIEHRPDIQFTPELFDIVSVDIPKIGLSGYTFRVAGIEHKSLTDNCQSVLTRLYLEPYASADDFWRWDDESVFDTSTIFGW